MTDSNATELKHCPFCGGEPYYYAPGPAEHHIECVQCHAETDGWMEKEQAIEAWNTRAERTCRIIEHEELPYPVCSECGAIQPDDYTVYYCWSCGAKVVGE